MQSPGTLPHLTIILPTGTAQLDVSQVEQFLTRSQAGILSHLRRTKWKAGVRICQFCQVLHCLQPYEDIQQMLDSCNLPELLCTSEHSEQLDGSLSLPVSDGGERKLILGYRNGQTDWIGVNQRTIKKIPFLCALFSERWANGDLVPTVMYVHSDTIKLIDYVVSFGKNFIDTPLATLHLERFSLTTSQLVADLDYLNIEYREELTQSPTVFDLQGCFIRAYSYPYEQISQEDAEQIVWVIQSGGKRHQLERMMIKDWMFYFVFEAVRNTSLYGRNLSRLLFYLCKDWVMEDQWERLELEVNNRKLEDDWFCKMDKDETDDTREDPGSAKQSEYLRKSDLPLDFEFIHEMGGAEHGWLLPGV